MKSLLFVGAGIEAIPGLCLAKKLGLFVIVSDANPAAPGVKYSDDFILSSTYDVESTVSKALQYHKTKHEINGVICMATDVPLTVAAVAEALNLPGISLASARLASNKLLMKRQFLLDQIPIPWFASVSSAHELTEYLSVYPQLVLKPVDSRGARGVQLIDETTDLGKAIDYSLSFSPTNSLIVEEYICGPQVSTESIVVNGKCFTPGFSDRNYEFLDRFSPFFVENGGQLPCSLDQPTLTNISQLVANGARSLGITNGIVKGDLVLKDGKPHIIELAARLSGGYFCSHEIPLNCGVDLVLHAIQQSLGIPIDTDELIPKFSCPVAQRYWFPSPGKVTKIIDNSNLLPTSNIKLIDLRVQVGDTVSSIDNHPARAGLVITTGSTVAEAITLAEDVIKSIDIVTV